MSAPVGRIYFSQKSTTNSLLYQLFPDNMPASLIRAQQLVSKNLVFVLPVGILL